MTAPPRILVLQMCRMGDTLQTTPMLRGLRRERPGAEITLVLLDGFASTPVPEGLYDRRVLFPHKALARDLAAPAADWPRALALFQDFVHELGDQPFDLSINLTQSDLSSLLMAIVPARDRRGPVITPLRKRSVRNDWMKYFWADARSRVLGCFNLVDLFTWTAGVGCDGGSLEMTVSGEAERSIEAALATRGLGGRPMIALQLGASDRAKRWPTERFAATADLLPPEAGEIVIVGTAAERPLAERFLSHARRPVHDFIGATSLQELGALLRRCRLLVTNDTGTMHVATAVGTRVVDISTGPVFVHETGPYGAGHVVVEPLIDCFPCTAGAQCHHHACRHRLEPAEAAAIVRFALDGGEEPRLAESRVLLPRRASSGRIEYWPVDPTRVTRHDLVRYYSASMWEETLVPPSAAGNGSSAGAPHGGPVVPQDTLEQLLPVLAEVECVASRASSLARRLPKASPRQRSGIADAAHQQFERLLVLGETERACHPIVGFLLVEIESMTETDLEPLARAQANAYASAAERARRLAALLRAHGA